MDLVMTQSPRLLVENHLADSHLVDRHLANLHLTDLHLINAAVVPLNNQQSTSVSLYTSLCRPNVSRSNAFRWNDAEPFFKSWSDLL